MTKEKSPYVVNIDIDNCLADYTGALKQFMMNVNPNLREDNFPEPVSYSFVNSGWPFESMDEFIDTHNQAVREGIFRAIRPIKGGAEAINKLRSEGVYVRIVTHRIFCNKDKMISVIDTVAWLNSHGIEFDAICFEGSKADISSDGFIDDSPGNVESIRERRSSYCFVFDQPYNRNLEGPRVYNWDDAVRKILAHKERIGK